MFVPQIFGGFFPDPPVTSRLLVVHSPTPAPGVYPLIVWKSSLRERLWLWNTYDTNQDCNSDKLYYQASYWLRLPLADKYHQTPCRWWRSKFLWWLECRCLGIQGSWCRWCWLTEWSHRWRWRSHSKLQILQHRTQSRCRPRWCTPRWWCRSLSSWRSCCWCTRHWGTAQCWTGRTALQSMISMIFLKVCRMVKFV